MWQRIASSVFYRCELYMQYIVSLIRSKLNHNINSVQFEYRPKRMKNYWFTMLIEAKQKIFGKHVFPPLHSNAMCNRWHCNETIYSSFLANLARLPVYLRIENGVHSFMRGPSLKHSLELLWNWLSIYKLMWPWSLTWWPDYQSATSFHHRKLSYHLAWR